MLLSRVGCAFLSCLALGMVSSSASSVVVIQAIRGDQNHLFVPISINLQKQSWWLVDTGAPISTITETAARRASLQPPAGARRTSLQRLQPPEIAAKIPSSVKVEGREREVVIAQKIVSEGFDFGEEPMAVLRLDALEHERMRRVSQSFGNGGILGLSILKKYGALINCRTKQIFLNRNGGPLPVHRSTYEQMGFTYIPIKITPENHVEALGTIGTGEYSFLIDTGASATLVLASIREKERIPFYTERTTLVGVHDFNNPIVTSGLLRSFRLGSHDLSNSFVGFADLNLSQSEFTRPLGGIIGAEILWDHHAIIDLGNRALYLKARR